MNTKIANNPIISSMMLFAAFYLLYRISVFSIHYVVMWDFYWYDHTRYILVRAALRLVISIPAIAAFTVIIQKNGFKFAFRIEGYKKGLLAIIPVFVFILIRFLYILNINEYNASPFFSIQFISFRILFEFATGIFEEILFRGILLTPILYHWGESVKGRLIVIFIVSILFGLAHYSGGVDHIIFATWMGISYAAAYMYSKNFFCVIVYHMLWNIAYMTPLGVIVVISVHSEVFYIILNYVYGILEVSMLAYAIILIIKSKQFVV